MRRTLRQVERVYYKGKGIMGEDPGVRRANEGCRETLVRQVREKRADSLGCGAETADSMSGWMILG